MKERRNQSYSDEDDDADQDKSQVSTAGKSKSLSSCAMQAAVTLSNPVFAEKLKDLN